MLRRTAGVVLAAVLLFGPVHVAADAPLPFLVCADPNDMPYSDAAGEGFENRLASLVAGELGMSVQYYWVPSGRATSRALDDGLCDVVMASLSEEGPLVSTYPYYRSTYVFVSRADRHLDIATLDDPRLRSLRIGVPLVPDDAAGTPALIALARRGVVDNVVGRMVIGDGPEPQARFVEAVETGEVDVAILWGPLAGYYAKRSPVPLVLQPVEPSYDPPGLFFIFSISAAVRAGDNALADLISGALLRRRQDIDALVAEFGIPVI